MAKTANTKPRTTKAKARKTSRTSRAGASEDQHKAVKYAETSDPAPTGTTTVETDFRDGYDVFTWRCPRCKGESHFRSPRKVQTIRVGGGAGKTATRTGRTLPGAAAEAAIVRVPIVLRCRCDRSHAERPAEAPHGCGHYFLVNVGRP